MEAVEPPPLHVHPLHEPHNLATAVVQVQLAGEANMEAVQPPVPVTRSRQLHTNRQRPRRQAAALVSGDCLGQQVRGVEMDSVDWTGVVDFHPLIDVHNANPFYHRLEPGPLGSQGPPAPEVTISPFPAQCPCEAPTGEPGPKGEERASDGGCS
jgi:hypothetical protein